MNDMILSNNQNLVLSSLEVAEMIEKSHANLMKDIRKYSGYLAEVKNDPNEVKIDLVEFWTESTYNDAKGERRPCYMVTKKGCEFIAYKTTGQKVQCSPQDTSTDSMRWKMLYALDFRLHKKLLFQRKAEPLSRVALTGIRKTKTR